MIHVALYQPMIPPNTGTTARQCVGMDAHLHLIGPVVFDLGEHAVKRAGLDYWPHLTLTVHPQPADFLAWLGPREPWLISKFGPLRYDHAGYADGDVLLFGNEVRGLPGEWRQRWQARQVFIPIMGPVRSYNLANAVAIVLAEASRRAGLYDRRSHRLDASTGGD